MRLMLLLLLVLLLVGCKPVYEERGIYITGQEEPAETDEVFEEINQRASAQGAIEADQGMETTDFSNEIFATVQHVDTGLCSYRCGYLLYQFNYTTGEPAYVGFRVLIGGETPVTPKSNIVQVTCSMNGMIAEIINESVFVREGDVFMSGNAPFIIDLPNCKE